MSSYLSGALRSEETASVSPSGSEPQEPVECFSVFVER